MKKKFVWFSRDFLPRGSGIVTRQPLILKLVKGPKGKEERVFPLFIISYLRFFLFVVEKKIV